MAALSSPSLLDRISPELGAQVQGVCRDPDASLVDSKAVAKTLRIVNNTYDHNGMAALQELAEKLTNLGSEIACQYADRLKTAFEEHKRFKKKIIDLSIVFDKAINIQLGVCCGHIPYSQEQAQKYIQAALNYYHRIESEFPLASVLPVSISDKYKEISRQHTLKREQFEHTLQNLQTSVDTALQEKSDTALDTKKREIKILLSETLSSFFQKTHMQRELYMMSVEPIKAHMEFVKEVIARLSLPQGITKETTSTWQNKILELNKHEPDFEIEYNGLFFMLDISPISPQLIDCAAKILVTKIVATTEKIMNQIKACLEKIAADTVKAAPSRIAERTCANTDCPLKKKQKIKKGKGAVVNLATGFFKCGRCQQVYYCSPECQKADFSVHKKDCHPAQMSTE